MISKQGSKEQAICSVFRIRWHHFAPGEWPRVSQWRHESKTFREFHTCHTPSRYFTLSAANGWSTRPLPSAGQTSAAASVAVTKTQDIFQNF
jgi:hypothetical protein